MFYAGNGDILIGFKKESDRDKFLNVISEKQLCCNLFKAEHEISGQANDYPQYKCLKNGIDSDVSSLAYDRFKKLNLYWCCKAWEITENIKPVHLSKAVKVS